MALVRVLAVNGSSHEAQLLWCDPEGQEVAYGEAIRPGGAKEQETFVGHKWRLRSLRAASSDMPALQTELTIAEGEPEQTLLLVEVEDGGSGTGSVQRDRPKTQSFYSQAYNVGIGGLQVKAAAEVGAEALSRAADVVRGMLQESPASVLERLESRQCSVAIIGRKQKTSDIPEHHEWAIAAQRPVKVDADAEALCLSTHVSHEAGSDACHQERIERAKHVVLQLQQLAPDVLCRMLGNLVEDGIVSDVTLLTALAQTQAAVASPAQDALDQNEITNLAPLPPDVAPNFTGLVSSSSDEHNASSRTLEVSGGVAPVDCSIDATTRGVGGGQVTSVGEENLGEEIERDPHYPDESILVHEFGTHACVGQ